MIRSNRMGSYTIDSHNIQRYITPEGYVQNEGDIGVSTKGPYQIAYGALAPKKGQADNLLVPVCLSSSHIAFGSIRMEPVFMILGQSAATAAVLAIDGDTTVQDVPYVTPEGNAQNEGNMEVAVTPYQIPYGVVSRYSPGQKNYSNWPSAAPIADEPASFHTRCRLRLL